MADPQIEDYADELAAELPRDPAAALAALALVLCRCAESIGADPVEIVRQVRMYR